MVAAVDLGADWGSEHLPDSVGVALQERPLDRRSEGADVHGGGQPRGEEDRVLDSRGCCDARAPGRPHGNCSYGPTCVPNGSGDGDGNVTTATDILDTG